MGLFVADDPGQLRIAALVAERVRVAAKGGANAGAKIVALVTGMVAGADCIDDMDLLRPKTGDH
ncbi:MAG TPA: hypothetical protein VE645_08730 [Pseudonocardiaceae bacterium]|nr:hypothetical protein [Pseudonocardiaceae bacterium]